MPPFPAQMLDGGIGRLQSTVTHPNSNRRSNRRQRVVVLRAKTPKDNCRFGAAIDKNDAAQATLGYREANKA